MKKVLGLILLLMMMVGCTEKEKVQEVKDGVKIIGLKDLEKLRKNENTVVIDTRSYDEYNGWDTKGNGIEGHIPGALNMPLMTVDKQDIEKTLSRKGVAAENEIVLYGEGSQDLAVKMVEKGYNVSSIEDGAKKWKEAGKSFDALANKKMIVPASWVKDLIEGKEVAEYDVNASLLFKAYEA